MIEHLKWWKWLLIFVLSFGFAIALHASQIKQQNSAGVEIKTPLSSQPNSAKIEIETPLSTRGARIVDAKGRTVLLRGVNWFGMETELHAPHGLWARDYREMLAQIKSLGYNTIRLPYSVQSLRSSSVGGIDFTIGANRELEGKSPIEVMDAIVKEADRQGLTIILDSHRLDDRRIPELWYGDGFTEADWIDTWKMLANRYKDQKNVIGADLKNEPHGKASWGTGDPKTDWRLAAERAGNAILSINPNWLIIVEGVEKNVPGQQLKIHWMGGNLEGVSQYPVRLSIPKKVVYSPHEYGPGTFNQPWFSEPSFPQNLFDRWEKGFHYIATREIAPILIGEFGGKQVDPSSKEGIWQRQLVDYIAKNNLSFTYWSWNPNSADTGGILQDDWKSVNIPKQQLLSKLLVSKASAAKPEAIAPTVKPNVTNSAQSKPNASINSDSLLRTEARVQSDWKEGFCMSFKVTNLAKSSTRDWQLKFQMERALISQSWNGKFSANGNQYIATPLDWGKTIAPNQSVDLGFCANKLGPDYQPKQVSASGSYNN